MSECGSIHKPRQGILLNHLLEPPVHLADLPALAGSHHGVPEAGHGDSHGNDGGKGQVDELAAAQEPASQPHKQAVGQAIGSQAVGDWHLNEDGQAQHRCDKNGGLCRRIPDQVIGIDSRVPEEGKKSHPVLAGPSEPGRAPAKQPPQKQVNGRSQPRFESPPFARGNRTHYLTPGRRHEGSSLCPLPGQRRCAVFVACDRVLPVL